MGRLYEIDKKVVKLKLIHDRRYLYGWQKNDTKYNKRTERKLWKTIKCSAIIMKVYEFLEKMFEEEEIRDIDFEVSIENGRKTSFCEGGLKISVNVLGHDQMRVSTGCRSSSPFTLLKRE